MRISNKKRHLRSGYTTGACAAAAAKAAAILAVRNWQSAVGSVEIPLPDRTRIALKIHSSGFNADDDSAFASVIKDAGDDPDVTNGAEIIAAVRIIKQLKQRGDHQRFAGAAIESGLYHTPKLIIKGGKGVGIVTKPGLPVVVGGPAINPMPRKMIQESVMEAVSNLGGGDCPRFTGASIKPAQFPASAIEITISVKDGEIIAKKTLNSRLGIIGGISILGTTGIVRPISSEAWTATITYSMDVAKAMGHNEIVLSAGRASEKAHMERFKFPEECYVMMGDYLEFALVDAKKHGFKKIHLCAQWAKMLKIAMSTPQTHVRHGALDTKKAVMFLKSLGIVIPNDMQFNTAREIFDSAISHQPLALAVLCKTAQKYAEEIASGIPVITYLVSYDGEIIANAK